MKDIGTSGYIGRCRWCIDEEGTLTVSPVEGTNGFLWLSGCTPAWYEHREKIRKVVIEKGVKAGRDISWLFAGLSLCEVFDLENFDTEHAADMSFIFSRCASAEDLSCLKSWNTRNVKRLENAFYSCVCLEDISFARGWDTGSVTDMRGLFSNCFLLEDISPLSGWNVRNLKFAKEMFGECTRIKDVSPLSRWKTDSLVDAKDMFPAGIKVPFDGPCETGQEGPVEGKRNVEVSISFSEVFAKRMALTEEEYERFEGGDKELLLPFVKECLRQMAEDPSSAGIDFAMYDLDEDRQVVDWD